VACFSSFIIHVITFYLFIHSYSLLYIIVVKFCFTFQNVCFTLEYESIIACIHVSQAELKELTADQYGLLSERKAHCEQLRSAREEKRKQVLGRNF